MIFCAADHTRPVSGSLYSGISDITLLPGQWRSLWVTVPAECSLPSGSYDLTIAITEENGTVLNSCTFVLERLNARLPEQTLIHTEWFHTDCIADWYKVPLFSVKILGAYLRIYGGRRTLWSQYDS